MDIDINDNATYDRFDAIVARTRTIHEPTDALVFDCAKVTVIRDGSAVLLSEVGQQPVTVGDVVVLAARTEFGYDPDGRVTATTVDLDTDYVIDQLYWQHARLFRDRCDAQVVAARVFAEPAQILRVGEHRSQGLAPWLDRLVALSSGGGFAENFFQMQAAWFNIAHVLAPFITALPPQGSRPSHSTTRPTPPRLPKFAPVRPEARQVAELLRHDPVRRWSIAELAEAVHLSKSQVGRLFVKAYGRSPIAYLTMLRVEQMSHLLRTTDMTIAAITGEVGWDDRSFAARQFHRHVGMSPTRYRAMYRAGAAGSRE